MGLVPVNEECTSIMPNPNGKEQQPQDKDKHPPRRTVSPPTWQPSNDDHTPSMDEMGFTDAQKDYYQHGN